MKIILSVSAIQKDNKKRINSLVSSSGSRIISACLMAVSRRFDVLGSAQTSTIVFCLKLLRILRLIVSKFRRESVASGSRDVIASTYKQRLSKGKTERSSYQMCLMKKISPWHDRKISQGLI